MFTGPALELDTCAASGHSRAVPGNDPRRRRFDVSGQDRLLSPQTGFPMVSSAGRMPVSRGVVKHIMLDGSGCAAATELQAGSWMICSRDSCHAPNLDHGDHRDNNYQAVGMRICGQRADSREKQRRQAGIRDEYHIGVVAGQQQGDSLPPRPAKAGHQVHRVCRLRLADFAACSLRRVVEDGDHGCVVVSKLWRMAVTTTALNKVQVPQSRHGLRRRCSTSDRLLGLS